MEQNTNISDSLNNANDVPEKGDEINNDPKTTTPEIARPTPHHETPPREIDVETPAREVELPPKSDGPTSTLEYRWNYGEQLKHNKKSRSNAGVLTFAIIMTIAFCICFVTLIGVMLYEDASLPSRTIFVREYDSESGVLTLPEIYDKVAPATVAIAVYYENEVGMGIGTGIIMTEDGYIATNYHVVEKGKEIKVIRNSGEEYTAKLIGYDSLSDLALLKISARNLPVAAFGNSDALIVGEKVVAIGTPSNLDYMGTTTDGIISAINRDVKIYDETAVMIKKMTLIQTNAALNPGNSGGPLINEYGEVIGIVTMRLADSDFYGISFAIPSNGAKAILEEIKETGSASGNSSQVASKRALLGIYGGGIRVGDSYVKADGTTGIAEVDGVIVIELNIPESDAAKLLMVGDIVTKLDGKTVDDIYDVMAIVNEKSAGDRVSVTYYRDGVYNTVDITLASE